MLEDSDYKEPGPTFPDLTKALAVTLAFVIAGLLVGQLLLGFVIMSLGLTPETMNDSLSLDLGERNTLRGGLLISHVMLVLVPAIAFVLLYRRESLEKFFQFSNQWSIVDACLWGLVIFFSYPFLGQLTIWNNEIPLADWMVGAQDGSTWLLEQTLNMTNVSELIVSLLLVGVSAAVGEELLFRGIIQRYLVAHLPSPHLAIIVASLIFGLFHMQLARFIPLTFLGLLLGYSYYYTKSIWVPIILHFLNNGLQVLGAYVALQNGELPDIDKLPEMPILAVIVSVVLTLGLFFIAQKRSIVEDSTRP